MDQLKHPGTILAAVDLVAIVTAWVYLQRQINDLKKEVEKLEKEDTSIKDGIKKQIELISQQMNVFIQNFNNLAQQVKFNTETMGTMKSKMDEYESQQQSIFEILHANGYNSQRHNAIYRMGQHVEEYDQSESNIQHVKHHSSKNKTLNIKSKNNKNKDASEKQSEDNPPTLISIQTPITAPTTNINRTKGDFVERVKGDKNSIVGQPKSNVITYQTIKPLPEVNLTKDQTKLKNQKVMTIPQEDTETSESEEEEEEEEEEQIDVDYVAAMATKKAKKK